MNWCIIDQTIRRVMVLLKTELAYIAALIDGEGCIYVEKFIERRKGKYTGKYSYTLRLKISMTCFKTLNWMKNVISKSYKCYLSDAKPRGNPKWKDIYAFTLSTAIIPEFCKEILPYMITKKERCKLAIEYANTKFNNRKCGRTGTFMILPEDLRNEKENIYQKIKTFNQKGE
jgi:hypothetical protein